MDIKKSKFRRKLLDNNIKIMKYDNEKIIIPYKHFHYYTIQKIQEELSQEKREMTLIHFEEYNGSKKLIALELLD